MKILNKLIIGIVLLTFVSKGFSQCATHSCDPQLTGFGFNVECIELNGPAVLSVGWFLGGGDPGCTVPPGSWRIQISLPLSGIYGSMSVADVISGSGFDWVYSDVNKTFTGTNNVQMNWLAGGSIMINVTGMIVNNCVPIITQGNIQIVPLFMGGCPQAFANQIANDALSSGKGVDEAMPILLSRFNAKPLNCTSVEIEVNTELEVNNDFIELQRSIDGKTYETVTKFKGEGNTQKGRIYTYVDQNLQESMVYYYRLRQVDTDGKQTVHRTISAKTSECPNANKDLSLYPNPSTDKIFISMKGFKEEFVDVVITNAIGELVRVVNNVSTRSPNELKLNGLAPGIYNIKVNDHENSINKRFIKIDNSH